MWRKEGTFRMAPVASRSAPAPRELARMHISVTIVARIHDRPLPQGRCGTRSLHVSMTVRTGNRPVRVAQNEARPAMIE